jgi:hypothetical protein
MTGKHPLLSLAGYIVIQRESERVQDRSPLCFLFKGVAGFFSVCKNLEICENLFLSYFRVIVWTTVASLHPPGLL